MNVLCNLSSINLVEDLRTHPLSDIAHRMMEQDVEQLGIKLDSFHDYTTMSAYIFTYDQISLERFVTIGLLNNLLFWIDDTFDRNVSNTPNQLQKAKMYETAIHVLLCGEIDGVHSNPILRACFELHKRFQRMASPEWVERLIMNTARHLNASTHDLDDIVEQVGDYTVQDYIEHRDMDSGMEAEIDLIEFAYDFVLPQIVRDDPIITKARLMAMRIGGLMNDIFSYEKEVLQLNSEYNLLAVIMNIHQVSLQESVEEACQLINNYTDIFLSLEATLPQFANHEINEMVRLYYQGLKDQINGTWHWQFSGTNRYKSPTSPLYELRVADLQPI